MWACDYGYRVCFIDSNHQQQTLNFCRKIVSHLGRCLVCHNQAMYSWHQYVINWLTTIERCDWDVSTLLNALRAFFLQNCSIVLCCRRDLDDIWISNKTMAIFDYTAVSYGRMQKLVSQAVHKTENNCIQACNLRQRGFAVLTSLVFSIHNVGVSKPIIF